MPFRSVGSRLASRSWSSLRPCSGIVYLIVVRRYKRSLENQELSRLARRPEGGAPKFPAEFDLRALYVNEMAPVADARVAVLFTRLRQRAARAEADSSLDERSPHLDEDPIALLAYSADSSRAASSSGTANSLRRWRAGP